MKFLIDMPLSTKLVVWLNKRNHDAIHVASIGLNMAMDIDILEYAKSEQRTIITADLDFPRLLALSGAEGPSLILFRGGNYSEQETEELLERTLRIIPEHEILKSVIVIDKTRIRRRYLPL